MNGSFGKADARRRIVLTDHPWPDLHVEQNIFDNAGLDLVVGPSEASSEFEIDILIEGNDPAAVLTCWAPVSSLAVRAAPSLKIVARLGVGVDNIAVETATNSGIWVTNVPDYCVEEVSDHAVALLLSHFRKVVHLDRQTKALGWKPAEARIERFANLVIGIIGFGRIGRATARKLSAFGCRIIVVDRHPVEPEDGVEKVTVAELQARADAIVLHAPLLADTKYMVDDAFLGRCLRHPFLVNVSRGQLVDNAALLRALERGTLSGAALDVIDGNQRLQSRSCPART